MGTLPSPLAGRSGHYRTVSTSGKIRPEMDFEQSMSDGTLEEQWTTLYGVLRDVLNEFGVEGPYGDGDY